VCLNMRLKLILPGPIIGGRSQPGQRPLLAWGVLHPIMAPASMGSGGRMRIGIDARLLHYSEAGISQYILRLLEGLARLEIEEEIVVLRSRKQQPAAMSGLPFRSLALWTPPHNRFEQFALPLELTRLKLDLLHSPDFIPPLRRRFRSVITVHDLAFLRYPHLLTRESAHYYAQIDQGARSADRVIAVSESTKRDVIQLLGVPEDRVVVIYEAYNPAFRPLPAGEQVSAVRDRYGLPERFVLFVGTIEPRKNLPTLLKAFRLLLDGKDSSLLLVVAGQWGWLYDEVQQTYEQLRLGQRVRFLGHVPTPELVALYNAALVLAYPSYYEGFGLPPLEAMACGTPVVAARTSSIPEVVGDAGLLVDPDDIEGLAAALWRAIDDSEVREVLIRRGLERAKAFSVDRMAKATLAVYRAALLG